MPVRIERKTVRFRKEPFEIMFHFYQCQDTGERIEDEVFIELNHIQAVNQYREKYGIPFPDKIQAIREQYDLSAAAMAEILGLGINSYRQYEAGEVPTLSNARLIQLAAEPREFKKLILLCPGLQDSKKEKILHRVEALIQGEKFRKLLKVLDDYFLGNARPGSLTGYREPSLPRFTEMVVFFSEKLQPFKPKLNKLLFLSDFSMFSKTGFSISGLRYCAIPLGPVPDNFNGIYEYLAKNDEVDIHFSNLPGGSLGEQFFSKPRRPFNEKLFTEAELNLLESIAWRFKNTSADEMIRLIQQEKAWKEKLLEKNYIDYRIGFGLRVL